jgi:glycine/D-amino acid oxidase-like deaminating enzyme
MSDTMNDIEEPVSDETEADHEEIDDGEEPSEEELADATVPPDPATGGDVESIQELLVKQEAAEEAEAEEEEPAIALTKDERLVADPGESRVTPMQSTEFLCQRCFLVKHRSQLADKKRTLCRDCA